MYKFDLATKGIYCECVKFIQENICPDVVTDSDLFENFYKEGELTKIERIKNCFFELSETYKKQLMRENVKSSSFATNIEARAEVAEIYGNLTSKLLARRYEELGLEPKNIGKF